MAVVAIACTANAQAIGEKGSSIALTVIVEDLPDPFPATAKVQLTNKLNALMTQNGIASADVLNRFFLTAIATPLTKDVVAGPPTQIAQNMEVAFYIADYYDQKVFATAAVTARGVGTNDNKCYLDAIRHINLNSLELKKFVEQGKVKIIDYYNAQADAIMAQAKSLAFQKNYEEALWKLSGIPSECEKYAQTLELTNQIYQQYIDYLCDVNLAKAKSAWAAQQNSDGAAAAGEFLSQIYPDAKCYADAEALYAEIKAKVLDDWKFEMKKYQDSVDLEAQRIEAARAVGVAYGENQQPTTTNVAWVR